MSKSEKRDDRIKIVSITENGQTTIPKEFRDKLDLTTPGKVVFRENEDGQVVVEEVPSAEEMRGFVGEGEAETEEAATELLRNARQREVSF